MNHVLIVDDEEAVCWVLRKALGKLGHSVAVASSAEEAFRLAKKQPPHAIILDVRLPGLDGLSALAESARLSDDAPVIVVTAFGNLSTAVRAVEGGAFDYLAKPFDLDQALDTVARCSKRRALQQAPAEPGQPEAIDPPEEMVGGSPAMQAVFKRIALVASRDACVLITGESGTGKELVARAIHRYSARQDRPVPADPRRRPQPESRRKRAVRPCQRRVHRSDASPARLARPGRRRHRVPRRARRHSAGRAGEAAARPGAQRGDPVGSNQPSALNIRILAATHQDLERKIAEGTFRHDLFFRLNVFQIHLPPLRERREDIVPLAEHFLRDFEPRSLPLTDAAARFLANQPWAGNVRELRNALEHAVILARGGPLLAEHFPPQAEMNAGNDPQAQLAAAVLHWLRRRIGSAGADPPTDLYEELLREVERPMLEELMRNLQGNRLLAAQWLGLNRATVRKKLAEYGLTEVHCPPQKSPETLA